MTYLGNFPTVLRRFINSTTWINRHKNDSYVKKSIQQDLRARSAFKLQEIQTKYKLIRSSDFVLDMGAAPGGWSVIASKLLGPSGLLISVDLLPIEPIKDTPHSHIIQGDMLSSSVKDQIRSISKGRLMDVVMSDMMVNMCGEKSTDHFRSMDLCHFALSYCETFLKPGGHFVCKYFRGSDEKELLDETKLLFGSVKVIKPDASRSESSEMYLVALNKKKANTIVPDINKSINEMT